MNLWVGHSSDGPRLGRPVSKAWAKSRRYLTTHIVAAIGDVPIDGLMPAHLWRIQDHCQKQGLSSETTNKITHSVWPALLRDLAAEGLLDPAVRERFRGMDRVQRDRPPTAAAYSAEERERAIAAFEGHWAYPVVVTLFLTGLRVGELSGLWQRDVDWRNYRLTVARGRAGTTVTRGKTSRSLRTIDAPARVIDAMAPLRDDSRPTDYLFRSARGEPFDVESFRRNSWGRMLRKAGLRYIRIHDCRHTAATAMLEAGVPIAQVAAYLGNTVEMTERTYAHVVPRFDVNAAMGGGGYVAPARSAHPHLRLVKG